MIEIITLVISIVALLAIIGLFIFVLVSRKKPEEDAYKKEMEMGMVMAQINNLQAVLKKDIELAVKQEMISISEQQAKNLEMNNEKLERFQKNIVESLNTRFEHINSQIAEKISELNKKVEDKLKEGFQSTSETMAQVRERLKVIDEAQKNMETPFLSTVSRNMTLK